MLDGRIIRWSWLVVLMLPPVPWCIAGQQPQSKDPGASQENSGKSSEKQKPKKKAADGDDQSSKLSKDAYSADASQYVGADTCKTCHEDVGKSFDQGPHWKTTLAKHEGPQWQGCEACHGPGKAHAEAGDPDKIIRFAGLSREESSKRCLSCHQFGEEHANFLRSQHLKNNVGCVDCHSVHHPKIQRQLLTMAQPQLCYSCHLEVKPDFSKPFHHRVNEGLSPTSAMAEIRITRAICGCKKESITTSTPASAAIRTSLTMICSPTH